LTIEQLIRKLRPVLGQKADALLLGYPDSRAEFARVVNALAAKYSNLITHEIVELLPSPLQEIADGEYPPGTVYYGLQVLMNDNHYCPQPWGCPVCPHLVAERHQGH